MTRKLQNPTRDDTCRCTNFTLWLNSSHIPFHRTWSDTLIQAKRMNVLSFDVQNFPGLSPRGKLCVQRSNNDTTRFQCKVNAIHVESIPRYGISHDYQQLKSESSELWDIPRRIYPVTKHTSASCSITYTSSQKWIDLYRKQHSPENTVSIHANAPTFSTVPSDHKRAASDKPTKQKSVMNAL
jgi:hypothetical protein